MVLPYQVPLHTAYENAQAGELESAQKSIERFFSQLEKDAMVQEIRKQHLQRQVFEADFLSILTREEIDAWAVLAFCRANTGDLEGARDACYRQIELMDEFYGYETPSWETPETRIPRDQELMPRFSDLTSTLSSIYEAMHEQELSERWSKINSAAAADKAEPDEVWGRWISEDGEDETSYVQGTNFWNWQLENLDVEGSSCLVYLNKKLSEQASPAQAKHFMTISIPTDERGEVPSKAIRWKIWRVRQAIGARLARLQLGVLMGETQRRGLRQIFFYTTDGVEAEKEVQSILKSVKADLKTSVAVEEDLGWNHYRTWGGSPVLLPTADEDMPPAPADEERTSNDALLRRAWKIGGAQHDAWARMYTLIWVLNYIPPADAALKRYCIDYLFELLQHVAPAQKPFALIHLMWKLPPVEPASAIRACDELWECRPFAESDHSSLNLAIIEFATVDPYRALKLAKTIPGYGLLHGSFAAIAKKLASSDPQLSLEVVQIARDHLDNNGERDWSKVTALTELTDEALALPSDVVHAILARAMECANDSMDKHGRIHSMYQVAAAAKNVAPDIFEEASRIAVESAFELQQETADPQDFFSQTGPRYSTGAQCLLAPLLADSDAPLATNLLLSAIESVGMVTENWDRVLMLESLANAIGKASTLNSSEQLAQRVWDMVADCVGSDGWAPDLRRMELIDELVIMNPAIAEKNFETVLAFCQSGVLPERQVMLLCAFAGAIITTNHVLGEDLIRRAYALAHECSSLYLIALSLAEVVAIASGTGFECAQWREEALEVVRSLPPGDLRHEALLAMASALAKNEVQLATALMEEADALAEQELIEPSTALMHLRRVPARLAGHSYLKMLVHDDSGRVTADLSQWAHAVAGDG